MADVKICPQCGHENDHYFLTCDKCGASLDSDCVSGEEKVQKAAGENKIASILKVVAIIIYAYAFLIGAVIVATDGFLMTLALWFGGFAAGSMFLGLSEIVRLLHEINQKK